MGSSSAPGRAPIARVTGGALLLVAAVLAAACGGPQQVYEVSPEEVQAELRLPDPIPAVPAFVVEAEDGFDESELNALQATPGAAVVAPVALQWVKVKASDGEMSLRVAAVDPLQFRPVAPASTRDADFVWLSLLTGNAVLTQDAAQRLGVGARRLEKGALRSLKVGALAENGVPNIADVLVDGEHFRPGRWGPAELAVVGAESGVTIQTLGEDLRERAPHARVRRIRPPNVEQPGVPQPYVAPLPTQSVSGLHPALAESVQRLLAAARGRVYIVSGFRTTARQYELWVGALQKYGDPEIANNWVAPPGHSYHEYGLAVDLGGEVEYAAQLVVELGLPMWRPMSWEPWHFELMGSRG